MAKKTLAVVITEVLRAHEQPMTASAVYEKIAGAGLFECNSKDPLGIVRNARSRHCEQNQHSCASKNKYFDPLPDGRFRPQHLLSQRQNGSSLLELPFCTGASDKCAGSSISSLALWAEIGRSLRWSQAY